MKLKDYRAGICHISISVKPGNSYLWNHAYRIKFNPTDCWKCQRSHTCCLTWIFHRVPHSQPLPIGIHHFLGGSRRHESSQWLNCCMIQLNKKYFFINIRSLIILMSHWYFILQKRLRKGNNPLKKKVSISDLLYFDKTWVVVFKFDLSS